MIATTRGLAILAAVAAALLVALVVAGPRSHRAVDRSLVPGLDTSRVAELVFTRGAQTIRITRAGNEWRWQDPPGLADPVAIDAVLTALRGGRWHRRAAAKVAGSPRAQLSVDGTSLGIGAPLAGSEQTWIVRGDDAVLVDTWVATALAPEPLALRQRHPLDCTAATSITATLPSGTVKVEATRLVEPRALWIDERWLEWLYDACAKIEIVALEPGVRAAQAGLRIRTDGGGELTQVGACDRDRILVDTSAGTGCIDAGALRELDGALRKLVDTPYQAIDLRPLPIVPAELTLQDGTALELAARPRIGDADADPERVRELVAALSARGETSIPLPATKPAAAIIAVDGAGTQVVLDLFDRAIARRGEQGAIQISPAQWATITRPTAVLRDPTRWREDPTTISSLTLDHVTYKRGAVLGEWTREPAGKVDPHLVDALAEAVATVRAPAGPPPKMIAHRLRVTMTPPAGAPTTHTLELAAPSDAGCAGRVDGTAVLLPLPLCTAVAALAAVAAQR